METTKQIEFWKGNFGKEYTERNNMSLEEWNQYYIDRFGSTKLQLNEAFIGNLSKTIKILEVGCNMGLQLMGLQEQGFNNLYGIELQWDAITKAKGNLTNVNIIQGSGFDLPFKDNYFDLVVTNGVLIHIAPEDLKKFMSEMVRCTSKYIWGFEYYAETTTEIKYRNNSGYLWKSDYCNTFLSYFKHLELVKKEILPYKSEAEKGNNDCMYLLKKKK